MSNPYGQPGYPPSEPDYQGGQPGYPPQNYPPAYFGGQSAYPPAQPGYPDYQQPAYNYQPVMYPPAAPSGGTAIAAAVLALIGGILAALVGLLMLVGGAVFGGSVNASDYDSDIGSGIAAFIAILGAIITLVGVLWIIGAILLLMAKTAGRVMLMVLSGLSVALNLVGFTDSETVGSGIVGLILAGLILGLAAAPPTGVWIAYKKQQKNQPPAGYAPYSYQ
ncbi:hypothetical protein [Nocardia crassostreae]|uniref:hypothetical protein n=1 Tax=Nocardia crassostreae TaxID=53428 RepID=UPI00082BA5A5|nr:hypothetical protein [Nocardia crassostreae]